MFRPAFHGATFDEVADGPRLGKQLRRVFAVMSDGIWRTPTELQDGIFERFKKLDPVQSLVRQMRYLRDERHGGHALLKRHRGDAIRGLWEYRVVVNQNAKEEHHGKDS